jgi:hypothetical protein
MQQRKRYAWERPATRLYIVFSLSVNVLEQYQRKEHWKPSFADGEVVK